MIAKFDGYCKVTHQRITAGVTNIEKINGVWQIAKPAQSPKSNGSTCYRPDGAKVVMAWSENDQDKWGDEIAKHYVAFGDDDGEVIGKIWNCGTADDARRMANEMYFLYKQSLEDVITDLYY